ncbi:MAG: alpha/beta fold hydrolase [Candidatus Thiodiazotropha sp. 6PLUC2]
MMKRLFLCSLLLLYIPITLGSQNECVVLLHGLGRSSLSLGLIEEALEEQGYHVWNESYPSLTQSVNEVTAPAIESGLAFCNSKQSEKIHFVTHSLGGILVRYYLQDHQIDKLGRIVMLAPPNKGSEITDEMKDDIFYKMILGPAGQVLGTDDNSLPNKLKPIDGEIGIIAGEKEGATWFLPEIPGKDDGKVAVERTKMLEMKDFLLVKAEHMFIMRDDEVIRQVVFFLHHGVFDRKVE